MIPKTYNKPLKSLTFYKPLKLLIKVNTVKSLTFYKSLKLLVLPKYVISLDKCKSLKSLGAVGTI